MIKSERKTLRLIKKKFGLDKLIFLDTCNHIFISDDIKVSYRYKNMRHIIQSLSKSGYLELSNHPTDIYFSLTYEGYYRFCLLMDSLKNAFITKWIPGFISGVATAVAVEWLISNFL